MTAVIVGGGAVGVDFHLPRLFGLCRAQSVCVVEPDQRRARELRNRFGDDERIDIVETLPADTRYDVAVLSMPPRYHGEYVERLGGRCDRLLIEKPIARNLREAEAIVRHLESSTAVAFVCHIRRALGSFRLARDIVAEGLLGELREVSVHEGSVFSWRAASLGSFSRELNGGGVLLDTGPHTLDLLFQVFQRIELKAAWMDADVRGGTRAIEANCLLRLEADGGIPIELGLSRNRHLSNKARFTFTRGSLSIDVRDNTLELAHGQRIRLHGTAAEATGRMEFGDVFDAFYRRFVVPGDNHGVAPSDAINGLRVIDDAYRQAVASASPF